MQDGIRKCELERKMVFKRSLTCAMDEQLQVIGYQTDPRPLVQCRFLKLKEPLESSLSYMGLMCGRLYPLEDQGNLD